MSRSHWSAGRLTRSMAVAAVASAATFALTFPGAASALVPAYHHGHHRAVPAPPVHPTKANQIQNVDQVKTAIKAYYGDTPTNQLDPVDGTKTLHEPSTTSAWAKETRGVARDAKAYLKRPRTQVTHHNKQNAILLDVDDTTLVTYNYEIYSNFVYNPSTNAAFVNGGYFPAVAGMPALVNWANTKGYKVFYLTGRPEAQRAGTIANLSSVGYPVASSQLYLKDYGVDTWLSSCAPTCTTDQYKTLTRKHIESLGYDIKANLGDQFSDLRGGHADRRFKVPNPMYFLP